jgi:hypothetical protein
MNRVHFIGADPGEPTKNFTGYLGGGRIGSLRFYFQKLLQN